MNEFPQFGRVFLMRVLGPRLLPCAVLLAMFSPLFRGPLLGWIPPLAVWLFLPALLFCWAWTDANLGGHYFTLPRAIAAGIAQALQSLLGYARELVSESNWSLLFVLVPLALAVLILGGCLVGFAQEPAGFAFLCFAGCLLDLGFLIFASLRYLPTFMEEVWPRERARLRAWTQYSDNYRFLRETYPYVRFQADLARSIPDDATPSEAAQGCRDVMEQMRPLIEAGRRGLGALDSRLAAIDREIAACRATIAENQAAQFAVDLADDTEANERRIRELEEERETILDRE